MRRDLSCSSRGPEGRYISVDNVSTRCSIHDTQPVKLMWNGAQSLQVVEVQSPRRIVSTYNNEMSRQGMTKVAITSSQ